MSQSTRERDPVTTSSTVTRSAWRGERVKIERQLAAGHLRPRGGDEGRELDLVMRGPRCSKIVGDTGVRGAYRTAARSS